MEFLKLEDLTVEHLTKILTEPKNSLTKQYKKLLEMDGYKLNFAPEMLDYIVDKAIEYKLGARGLRGLMETVMMDVMYELPSSKSRKKTFEVTREYAAQRIEKANLNQLALSGE